MFVRVEDNKLILFLSDFLFLDLELRVSIILYNHIS